MWVTIYADVSSDIMIEAVTRTALPGYAPMGPFQLYIEVADVEARIAEYCDGIRALLTGELNRFQYFALNTAVDFSKSGIDPTDAELTKFVDLKAGPQELFRKLIPLWTSNKRPKLNESWAKALGVSRKTMSRHVIELEDVGLVRRDYPPGRKAAPTIRRVEKIV